MKLERFLNPSQLEAVHALDGPVLVIAGAGSGKTRVIEYRVYHLVQSGVEPSSILLLTFTRRAAREMLARAAMHDPRCRNVQGGTFHSFAYQQLKRYGHLLGFTDSLSLLDEADAAQAIHRCATRLGYYDRERRFPRKQTLRNIISVALNKQVNVEHILRREYPHFLEYAGDVEKVRKDYAAYKVKQNYLDYDDLLLFLKLLLEDPTVQERLGRRYRYVMVDEYQDTNALQGEISAQLAAFHGNIMVVGDDAQSIYGFRGASYENILNFPGTFPGCRVVKLEQNYRSHQRILDVANAVLANMRHSYSKCLRSAQGEQGITPRLLFFKDSYTEAGWVAERIKKLRDEGIPLGRQGVLFRSAYTSIPLQAELSRRNIPYQMFGGLKFYETAHVKDILAHLKVLVNPRDELAWNRVLMLLRGVGPKTGERLSGQMVEAPHLEQALGEVLEPHLKKRGYGQGLKKLQGVLREANNEHMDVGARFGLILRYYQPILMDRFDDWHLRKNDLDTLQQIATGYASLPDFLADFTIEPPERGVWRVDPDVAEEERLLTLSTIHSAKGLEWDTVFLIALIDGILPVSFALNFEEDVEEERRLLYVALTRARRQLFLSMHHEGRRGGISQFNKISRFVDVPNVREALDTEQADLTEGEASWELEGPELDKLYDKSSLLERVRRGFNSSSPHGLG